MNKNMWLGFLNLVLLLLIVLSLNESHEKVLESKTNTTIYELEKDNYLKDLNKTLKNIIYNQDNIIDELTIITKKLLICKNIKTKLNRFR